MSLAGNGASADGIGEPTPASDEGRKLTIWGRKNSNNVQKVLWLCEELEIEFESIQAGGAFGLVGDPDFIAMNPNSRVPVIKDGGNVVWESNTVMRYLCNTRDGESLYPRDPYTASCIDRWLDWQLGRMPVSTRLFLGWVRAKPESRNLDDLEAARIECEKMWRLLEGELAKKLYIAGSFSICDISIGILARRWFSYPIDRPELPHLEDWYRRISERSGFEKYVNTPLT